MRNRESGLCVGMIMLVLLSPSAAWGDDQGVPPAGGQAPPAQGQVPPTPPPSAGQAAGAPAQATEQAAGTDNPSTVVVIGAVLGLLALTGGLLLLKGRTQRAA